MDAYLGNVPTYVLDLRKFSYYIHDHEYVAVSVSAWGSRAVSLGL